MSEQRPGDGSGTPGWPPPAQPYQPAPRPAWTPQQRAFPHAVPTPYHLMLRTWTYAWWRPVVGMLIAAAGMLIVAPLVLLPVLAAAVAVEGGPFQKTFEKAATLQTVDPAALLYLNLVLASMVLVTWFIIRFVHRMRPRWLASVVPRMRWSFFFVCLMLSVVALFAQILAGAVLPSSGGGGGDFSGHLNTFTATTAASALIVLLTTPLQAAGEEYLFRGYLLMAVGSLFRNKWVAIVVTAIFFALAHGSQNFPLFFDRLAFGLIAAWLVTYTGGLEAGIALHVLNNFLAFGLALAYGDLTSTLNVSESSWSQIPVTVVQSAVFTGLVVLASRRMGLRNTTQPPHEEPEQSTGPAVATA